MSVPFFAFAGVLLLSALAAPARGEEAPPDAPAALFLSRCGACHNVGRGESAGLDLSQTAPWPPEDLAGAVKRMEENVGPLADEEVQALVRFLKDGRAQARIESEEKRMEAQSQAESSPASAEEGKDYFSGRRALSGGGLACAACHRAGSSGGTLGPDLGGVFKKMGQTPLLSAIQNSDYKIMRAAYRSRPITAEEARHLAAFLKTIEGTIPAKKGWEGANPGALHGAGGAAAIAMLGLAAVFYKPRRSPARERLLRRKQ